MTLDFIDARSLVTLVSFITFLGIVWWAYGARPKSSFDEAANLPFADEPSDSDSQLTEKRHG